MLKDAIAHVKPGQAERLKGSRPYRELTFFSDATEVDDIPTLYTASGGDVDTQQDVASLFDLQIAPRGYGFVGHLAAAENVPQIALGETLTVDQDNGVVGVKIAAPGGYDVDHVWAYVGAASVGRAYRAHTLKAGAFAKAVQLLSVARASVDQVLVLGDPLQPLFAFSSAATDAREHEALLDELLSLDDGWDGVGSIAPTPEAKRAISEVFGQLAKHVSRAEIDVDASNGEVSFSWFSDHHTSSVTITVLPSGRVLVIKANVGEPSQRTVLTQPELSRRLARVAVDAGLQQVDA